jgi:thiamine biosynthesis lipoprotein
MARLARTSLLAALVLLLGRCGSIRYYKQSFFRMDTLVEVTLAAHSKRRANAAFSSVDSLLADWEQRFSQTHPRSEALAVNQAAGDTVDLSPLFGEMATVSLAYAESLGGDFDITILPVKQLWGFGETPADSVTIPDSAQIENALKRVGYRAVTILDSGSRLIAADSAVQLDLGGVAKGFSLREMAAILQRHHIEHYLIVAGGDISARGYRAGGDPWRIGIQHPRDRNAILAVVPLDSGSIVTSGDYERFWIGPDSTRYHHLFDTRTGRPCRSNQSLTVWSMDPIAADILSTGLFRRPADSIVSFIESRDGLECCGVDGSGNHFVSAGWSGMLDFQP